MTSPQFGNEFPHVPDTVIAMITREEAVDEGILGTIDEFGIVSLKVVGRPARSNAE